jgi:hypothetical protein
MNSQDMIRKLSISMLCFVALFVVGPMLTKLVINTWYRVDLFEAVNNSELQKSLADAINANNYFIKASVIIIIFSLFDIAGFYGCFYLLLCWSLGIKKLSFTYLGISIILTLLSFSDLYLESLKWAHILSKVISKLPIG